MPSPSNPRLVVLLELLRLNGLIARSVREDHNEDYIRTLFDIRRQCDVAIQQHTFRIPDLADEVEDDDEL